MRLLNGEETQSVAGGQGTIDKEEDPIISLLKFFFRLLLTPRNGWESTPQEKEFYEIYDEGRERYKMQNDE